MPRFKPLVLHKGEIKTLTRSIRLEQRKSLGLKASKSKLGLKGLRKHARLILPANRKKQLGDFLGEKTASMKAQRAAEEFAQKKKLESDKRQWEQKNERERARLLREKFSKLNDDQLVVELTKVRHSASSDAGRLISQALSELRHGDLKSWTKESLISKLVESHKRPE